MAKIPKIIEPLDADFEDLSSLIVASQEPLAPIVESTALPAFAKPDDVPVAVVKGVMKIGSVEIDCAVLGLSLIHI